jgi:outer membrane biosynthesis protein TonB
MPMHELVLTNLQTKLRGRLRRFSFAGNGLPERMRSTAFAFLGLTAASGLALVAIFAQLSFPLLSPAPLPSGPAGGSAVSEAVALDHSQRPSVPAGEQAHRSGAVGTESDRGGGPGGGKDDHAVAPVAAAPTPPTAPAPDEGASGGRAVDPPGTEVAPTPAPSAPPQPAPAAASPPAPAPVAKPAPTPARPAAPTPPPAPGNSQSAAASHASERGVEASSKSTPEPAAAGAVTSGSGPVPESSPGNGNGKALGHGK